MELNLDSSVLEIDHQLCKTFGIHLSNNQMFTIRQQKMLHHLEQWRIQNPLEFKTFKDLSWEYSRNIDSTHALKIIFEDIKIHIGRRDEENYIVMSIGHINKAYSYKILPSGKIDGISRLTLDSPKLQNCKRIIDFLNDSQLIDINCNFVDSIWK